MRRWFAGLSFRQWRQTVVVVILAATAVFGGLDTVDTKVTPFEPGEEFNDGEFTVTVERARLLNELTGGRGVVGPAKPGRRYLGVVATLRNDGTVPGRLRNELDLQDQPDKESFGVWRYRDGSPIQTLGPGLTEQLAFTWILPEAALRPGQTVTLRVWKKKYTQLLVTYGGKEWIDSDTDYGETVVPVGVSQ
ncbi:MAG: hypothetical protein ACRDU5_11445 [Mycobacterium sp.]